MSIFERGYEFKHVLTTEALFFVMYGLGEKELAGFTRVSFKDYQEGNVNLLSSPEADLFSLELIKDNLNHTRLVVKLLSKFKSKLEILMDEEISTIRPGMGIRSKRTEQKQQILKQIPEPEDIELAVDKVIVFCRGLTGKKQFISNSYARNFGYA